MTLSQGALTSAGSMGRMVLMDDGFTHNLLFPFSESDKHYLKYFCHRLFEWTDGRSVKPLGFGYCYASPHSVDNISTDCYLVGGSRLRRSSIEMFPLQDKKNGRGSAGIRFRVENETSSV
jgi:hypothetical protein